MLHSVYLKIGVSGNVKDLSEVQNMMPFLLGYELANLKPNFLTGRKKSIHLLVCPETYLEPSRASTTEALTEVYILKFILYWYKVKSTIFLNDNTESFSIKALTEK